MKNITVKNNFVMFVSVLLTLVGIFSLSHSVSADYYVACPFSPAANRTIVNFSAELIWDYKDKPQEAYRHVSLPAGDYKVSLSSYNGYDGRDEVDQPNESYFVELRDGTTMIASSHKTPDLQDNVTNASWKGVVNSSLHVSQSINTVVARHADYVMTMGTPNSVNAGCVAFDLITPPPPPPPPTPPILIATCSVAPSSANVGSNITWDSSVSGGTDSYTYSWSGTDSLSSTLASTTKSYSLAGTKTGTVTVTSGGQSVVQSCTATVNQVQVQNQTLTGSCSVSPASVTIGGMLNWTSTASGGTGTYTYVWSGTDGLSSTLASTTKSYSLAGTKTGTVTIVSGTESVSYACTAAVTEIEQDNNNDDLTVSCDVDDSSIDMNEDVTFSADATGGDGDYDYDWDGDDGLNGGDRTVTWDYNDDGTKDATVTVHSDGQTASDTCSTRVNDDDNNNNNNNNDDLNVSCYANPTNPQIGQRMNWYADVDGGDGDYDYDWSGTDGLNTSNDSPSMTYNTSGTKRATIEVTDDDGNSDTDDCSIIINQNQVLAFSQINQTPITPAVYLSQVPYTGVKENASAIFVSILGLFSAYVAYVIMSYKKKALV